MSELSRRDFLGAGTAALLPSAAAAVGEWRYRQILLPPGSHIAIRTASMELAGKTGAAVVERAHTGRVASGEIILALAEEAHAFPDMSSMLRAAAHEEEWELVRASGGGLIIAGSTPRNICRAALGWINDPQRETDRLSLYDFRERFTMWDNSLNQMYRFSKGFDRRSHIREIARLGNTGIEINRYADPGGYHVRHRKFRRDSYAWYVSYAPALDAFVESSLTRGIYRSAELAANLADLREAAEIARSYGLKPGFVCYEPRCAAEEIFDRYPELRGSRTDHPGRSLQPRYALDIAHPRVLRHYAELVGNLMQQVPDLRYFVFWTQDSGSGLPFASKLYFGPNGSFLARSKTLQEMNANFTRTILEAGRKVNPEFEVIMEIGHEYTEEERKNITASLPRGVTLSHPVCGSLLKPSGLGAIETYVQQDSQAGVDPYLSLTVSAGFDAEPIIGVPAPGLLMRKFPDLRKLGARRIFFAGGVFSPPQCPFNINQELYAEAIRGPVPDLDRFLLSVAERWCNGNRDAARRLVEAWKTGDEAMAAWPKLNWYTAGPGQTQARWITRPLVPDITRLNQHERSAWERSLFTLPSDPGRWNLVFESGIRFFEDADFARAVRAFDEQMLPLLAKAVAILDDALDAGGERVIEDQRDRYRGMLLRSRTDRNLFDAQLAINNWLLKKGDIAAERQRLDRDIHTEIENTRDWIRALAGSRTNWFHLASEEETPFLYKTPIEDLKLKLEAMQNHIHDDPGPYLEDLAGPKRKLMFSAVQ